VVSMLLQMEALACFLRLTKAPLPDTLSLAPTVTCCTGVRDSDSRGTSDNAASQWHQVSLIRAVGNVVPAPSSGEPQSNKQAK
jgi:hypothetical protein